MVGLYDWNKKSNGRYRAPADKQEYENWEQNLTYTLARSVSLLLIGIKYKPRNTVLFFCATGLSSFKNTIKANQSCLRKFPIDNLVTKITY